MKLYPDWVMRVYHDITDGSMNSTLDSLQSRFGHILDFCFVGNLPGYGNIRGLMDYYLNYQSQSDSKYNFITGMHKMMWRFLTLSDPLVDVTLIRDLDSNLSVREVEAVTEWLKSSAGLHVMRDHVFHQMPILGAGIFSKKLNYAVI